MTEQLTQSTENIAASAAPGNVLVVDDTEGNRDALSRRLQRRGFSVTTAADGHDAMRCISEQSFDVVLLDIMMPGMNGLEVLDEVRKTRPPAELPIIMATAKNESTDVVDALRRGANDYVTKPIDFDVVLARVNTQIAQKRSIEKILALETRLKERNEQLESANEKLRHAAERTSRELKTAARIQELMLPTGLGDLPQMDIAWAFRPCQELAGDSLNVCVFDDGSVGIFVLDVSGHGVSASLLAVSATRLLSSHDPDSILMARDSADSNRKLPAPPSTVISRLDERFRLNPDLGQFITVIYALIDPGTGSVTYASAGHPGAILIHPSSVTELLDSTGLPVGVGEGFEQRTLPIGVGDRLVLYTDGIMEASTPAGEQFGIPRIIKTVQDGSHLTLAGSVDNLLAEVAAWSQNAPATDDMSVLAVQLL